MQHALERIIDEERLQGWEKGKLEGKLEGEVEKSYDVARAALRKGLGCQIVAEITGLSLADVEKLQSEVVN